MSEALMFGKPSLAVNDWMIPDTDPPRLALPPSDFVFQCGRKEISENIIEIMSHSEDKSDTKRKRDTIFSNIGNVCGDIMDAIDYYTGNGSNTGFMRHGMESYYAYQGLWN